MGSTRLPGKVLATIGAHPLLDHILGRLDGMRTSARVIVATSDLPTDDVIAAHCRSRGADCFRGSEQDVLARYVACMDAFALGHVVRLTGDNPFTDVEELDRLIELHQNGRFDYSESFSALPVGVGAEVFTAETLRRSDREGHAPHHREHVNEYILDNPAGFRIGHLEVPGPKRRPDVRLTVDTAQDMERARFIATHAAGEWATTEEAIALCSASA